jgi:subtilisin family serine protease
VRRRLLAVALVCVLLAAPFAPLPTAGDEHAVDHAGLSSQLRDNLDQQRADPPTVERDVRVVIALEKDGYVPAASGFEADRVYSREGKQFVAGSTPLSSVSRLSEDPRIRSVRISDDGSRVPLDDRVASGVATVGADHLHAANVTGKNVTVGVIDADFRVSHPGIADGVGAYRSFDSEGDWRHGTAVASVVADTAPGARLHLAAIGGSTTPEEYRRAVRWLLDSGADVVVDAGSYYAQPGDGSGEIARVAADAADETVFVTSTGNHARRYWAGNHSDGEWVAFDDGADGNYLNEGEPFSGRVDVSVRWDDWPETDTDYDVYLLRHRDGGRDAVVARSTGRGDKPFEHLETTVPRGRYYVSVRAVDPGNGTDRVELFSTRNLTVRSTDGLGAPATVNGVVAVGACRNGTVRPFSAPGADLVAPDAALARGVDAGGGTSFAAPYVAGVAALAIDASPGRSPETVRTQLFESAVDVGPEGVDRRSGYGRVNASAAGVDPTSGEPPKPEARA